MKFKKADLQDLIYAAVDNNIIRHTRWSVHHKVVFPFEGKFYTTEYSVGATESQDERPFEYAADEIECPEVREVEKLMKMWEPL